MVAPAPQQLLLELADAFALGDRLDRVRVDRERIRPHPHLAAVVMDDPGLVVDVEPEQVLAALQEVAPV